MSRILLAQPDVALATVLERRLTADRYTTQVVYDGYEALRLAREQSYDLLIIDLELPALDGFELLRQIRDAEVMTPVLATTALGEVDQRIRALDGGADDCVVKPIWYSEMTARMRALLRRRGNCQENILRVQDLELNRLTRTVARAGVPIELTPKEFALLEYLMRNAGQCVTRNMIVEHVWKVGMENSTTNVIDVYINYLRRKLDHHEPRLIHTLRGVGYQLGTAA